MYVSFLSRHLSAHPSSPGPGHSTQISILAPQQHLPPVGLGHPALSSVPPSPTRAWLDGWQAGCPCPPRLWAACPLLPTGASCRPMAATWRAMASRSLQSQCGAQPPDHPRTMAMANAHLSSTSQKPPLPPLPTAHCFACAPATRLLHRDKPLPCHCTPFFYRIPAHYGAGFALLMVADVAQRK